MMLQRSKSKLITIFTHVLVWVVFGLVIFFRHPVFSGIDISYQLWITQTITLSLLVIAFYVNSSFLVPRFLLKNNAVYYFVIISAIVVVIVFINAWLETAFPKIIQYPRAEMLGYQLRQPAISGHINTLTVIISALVLVIGTSITVIQKWQKDKQEREELEKDKVSSELSFLKAQINPHFFFNTLNNIYVLTAIDPKVAGEAIHQLSKMMRYLLYDTQQGDNMLSQEIAFVKNYISLMKLRLTDVVKINIDTPDNLQDMPLAPMILLPFVENAFKHGISATQPSYIGIVIAQKDKVLDMTINNSIRKDNRVNLETNSGIGLINTRRRLDLLYPGKYKLDICESKAACEYSVHLKLNL